MTPIITSASAPPHTPDATSRILTPEESAQLKRLVSRNQDRARELLHFLDSDAPTLRRLPPQELTTQGVNCRRILDSTGLRAGVGTPGAALNASFTSLRHSHLDAAHADEQALISLEGRLTEEAVLRYEETRRQLSDHCAQLAHRHQVPKDLQAQVRAAQDATMPSGHSRLPRYRAVSEAIQGFLATDRRLEALLSLHHQVNQYEARLLQASSRAYTDAMRDILKAARKFAEEGDVPQGTRLVDNFRMELARLSGGRMSLEGTPPEEDNA